MKFVMRMSFVGGLFAITIGVADILGLSREHLTSSTISLWLIVGGVVCVLISLFSPYVVKGHDVGVD